MFTVPSHETAAILHHDLLIQSAYLLDLFEVWLFLTKMYSPQ